MEELGKLHADRLRVKFDGSEEDADQKIDMLTPAITRIFREAESKLKDVSSQQQTALTAAEIKVRKNVQRYVLSYRGVYDICLLRAFWIWTSCQCWLILIGG